MIKSIAIGTAIALIYLLIWKQYNPEKEFKTNLKLDLTKSIPLVLEANKSIEFVTIEPKIDTKRMVVARERDYEKEKIKNLIRQVFIDNGNLAENVAYCESGLNTDAVNKQSGATGIFQIMPFEGRPSQEELKNSEININFAKILFDQTGGFDRHWRASKHCWGKENKE